MMDDDPELVPEDQLPDDADDGADPIEEPSSAESDLTPDEGNSPEGDD